MQPQTDTQTHRRRYVGDHNTFRVVYDYSSVICAEVNCNEPNFTFYFMSFPFVVIHMHCVLCTTAS